MANTGQVAGLQYAGFWRRFAAYIIDGVIVNIVMWVLMLTIGTGVGYFLGFIFSLVYIIGLWTYRGQTVGKMAMGVRIVKTDGTPISLGTAVLRFVGYWVSSIILGIGFLMIAWDSKKQGLHDKIASTYVVKVAKAA